jgi:hypothetical protein
VGGATPIACNFDVLIQPPISNAEDRSRSISNLAHIVRNALRLRIDVDANDASRMPEGQQPSQKPGLGPGASASMHNPLHIWAITDYFLGGEHIAHRPQRVRSTVRDNKRTTTSRYQISREGLYSVVSIFAPADFVKNSAIELVQENVAVGGVLWLRVSQSSIHDSKMALDPQLGACRSHLASSVRLRNPATYYAIGIGCPRSSQTELELADLISTKAEAGTVIALHPKRLDAKSSCKPWHLFQSSWQLPKPQTREVTY